MHIEARDIHINLPLRRSRVRRRLISRPSTSGGEIVYVKGAPFTAAISDVSFSIERGDTVALIGVNGSGKTTLLRTLAGIYELTSGHLDVQGRVSTMFSNALCLSDMETGRQNMEASAILHHISKLEMEARLPDILEDCGLGGFIDLPVSMYSQGMQARLGLAMAVQANPDILLIDEAMTQADTHFIARMSARTGLFKNKDQICVMATHAREIQDVHCNKAIWLDCGQLKAFGPYAEVRQAYQMSEQNVIPLQRA